MSLDEEEGLSLARYARACIREQLGGPRAEAPAGPAAILEPGACFVTLRFGDMLQGCIGSIEPRRPLVEDVAHNAVSAAFHDPRALPLAPRDVDALTVEVSVLSPLAPIAFSDEASAARALRPFEDGVVLRAGRHQGTFLPQVWDSLPDPREFLCELKRKAMLPWNYWSDDVELLRYRVQKFIDPARAGYREAAARA